MARRSDFKGFNDEDVRVVIDLGNKVQCRIREVLDNESCINVFDVSNNGSENSGRNIRRRTGLSNFGDRGWESDMFSADLGPFREKYRSKSQLSS